MYGWRYSVKANVKSNCVLVLKFAAIHHCAPQFEEYSFTRLTPYFPWSCTVRALLASQLIVILLRLTLTIDPHNVNLVEQTSCRKPLGKTFDFKEHLIFRLKVGMYITDIVY